MKRHHLRLFKQDEAAVRSVDGVLTANVNRTET